MRFIWLLFALGFLAISAPVRAEEEDLVLPDIDDALDDIADFDEDDEEFLKLLEEKAKVSNVKIYNNKKKDPKFNLNCIFSLNLELS